MSNFLIIAVVFAFSILTSCKSDFDKVYFDRKYYEEIDVKPECKIGSTFFCDKNGVFWMIKYKNGISQFNPKSNKVKNYTIKDGLNSNIVYSLLEDNSSDVWVATNKGLNVINSDSVYSPIFYTKDIINKNTSVQLENAQVKCMLLDSKGFFWFGIDNGIYKYDIKKTKNIQGHKNVLKASSFSKCDFNVGVIVEDVDGCVLYSSKKGCSFDTIENSVFVKLDL